MKRLTRKALIDPSWISVGEDRGIEWVTDRFVMMRLDLLRTPPKVTKHELRPATIRSVLDPARNVVQAVSLELNPPPRIEVNHWNRTLARLVRVGTGYVPVNAKAWDEWTSRPWHSIGVTARGVVVFHDLRRGKPVLAGLIMPMRISPGDYTASKS